MTSSLYKPNRAIIDRFGGLSDLMRVVRMEEVDTRRLDDIPEAAGADYLKLDVQGAELGVLRGAQELLKTVLVVETEIEFVALYEDQPLFADIDMAMREAGFLFHQFADLSSLALSPLPAGRVDPFRGQLLWGDAIYVRNFLQWRDLDVLQLLKLAVILHENYSSRDFALSALQLAEEKGGPLLWDDFCRALTGSVKERPPLL